MGRVSLRSPVSWDVFVGFKKKLRFGVYASDGGGAMTLKEYQQAIAAGAAKKFPGNNKWTQKDRLLSMQRQLSDIGAALQKEEGIYNHKSIHNSTNHSIAALIADALLLVEERRFDIEAEMDEAVKWYQDKK